MFGASGQDNVSSNIGTPEIWVNATPVTAQNGKLKSVNIKVFPDSGAGLCIGGSEHQKALVLLREHLQPTEKKVRAVGGL